MLICMNRDAKSNQTCGAQNRDGANFCGGCGKGLRLALQFHNPGTRVGDYRIVQMIGHGGFGAVYEAEYTKDTTVKVALKETFDPKHVQSFQREFAILEKLQHPHLPRYYDMFEEHGSGYLVMELVPGQSLEEVLKKRTQPVLESVVLGYALQLCDALSYLHNQNPPILHRDIKPANIRLTPEGLIKLVDFGLVKVGGGKTRESRRGLTPAYAPLEQSVLSSGTTDARSDLYSLGATLYHLLTNRMPQPVLERYVLSTDDSLPPPQQLNPSLSPQVAQAVITAMAIQPQKRYADAVTLKQALQGAPIADSTARSLKKTVVATQSNVPTLVHTPRPAIKPNTAFVVSQSNNVATLVDTRRPASKAKTTLVVSQTGGTPYKTITQAIKDAPPNSRILVRPGTYTESLTLDKPLTISGDGPVEKIIIESTDGDCLLMQTDHAEVRGLTLRRRAGTQGAKFFTVNIPQGELLLSDCDITSDSLACVAIHGSTANPVIRRCKIHHGKASGVFVYQKGQGTVEDCEIFGNALAGVSITEGGNPLIRRCKIHSCKLRGVHVYQKGQGTVEDCEIFGNASSGVEIKEGGNPLIQHCKIHDGKASGVYVHLKGQGTVKDCEIFGNALAGVEIRDESSPLIEGCKIYDQPNHHGVYVYSNGQGSVDDCQIFGNALAGVSIKQGGDPVIRRCKVHDGKAGGILVYEKGQGTVEDCEIFGNALAGVSMGEGGNPLIRHCKIYDGKASGVFVYEKGQGTVEDCEIFGNALAGVEIKQESSPLIKRCKIYDGKQSGVYVYENSQGTVEDCEIFGNALRGVSITEGANPLIRRCKIYDGKEGGVMVYEKGQGTVEDCEIFGNALSGVEIKQGGNPLIQRCSINRNKDSGVWVHKDGAGRVENCDLTGNTRGAWRLDSGWFSQNKVQRSGNKQ
ncbi:MAG: right-handed parallel beta-helix repeat-containing protein [Ardenticatenaceae bacterium]